MTRYFAQAFRGSTRLAMHAANVGEVYYVAYRQGGETKAEQVFAHLHKLPIEILSRISNDLLKEAGRLKGTYPIAYGDRHRQASRRRNATACSRASPHS